MLLSTILLMVNDFIFMANVCNLMAYVYLVFLIGDRVAVELGIPCRKCSLCKEGKYNLCKPWSYGGLQNYLVHPADFCHK